MPAPMTMPQQSFVGETIRTVKKLMDLYGTLVELDALWAGASAYNSAIDQEAIDSVPTLVGMTQQNLADGEFALSTIKGAMSNAIVPLSILDNMPG